MKKIKLNALFALLTAIVFLAGCSKDEEKPNNGLDGYVAPTLAEQDDIIEVPAAIENSNDVNLSYAKGMLATINGYSSYMANFQIPEGAVLESTKSTTKTWRWTYGQFTMWVEFTEADLNYKWVLYYQDGQTFVSKTKIIEATQNKLGTSGELKIYYGLETAIATYTWEKVGSTVNATMLYSYGGQSVLMTLVANDNGAGEFDMYKGTTTLSPHVFHVQWDATAQGSWWVKDEEGLNEFSGEF